MPAPASGLAQFSFQCPGCGHELQQSIGALTRGDHMTCPGCGVGINIDVDRAARVCDEMRKAFDKVPPEITIKFFPAR
jgi:transcription elongation factor Elf1